MLSELISTVEIQGAQYNKTLRELHCIKYLE